MSNTNYSKMSFGTAWEIPWKCWEMMKINYPLALGIGFMVFLSNLIAQVPFIGPIISDPIFMIFTMACMFVARDWEAGKKSDFQTFINRATDAELIKKILPILIISVLLASLTVGSNQAASLLPGGNIIAMVVSFFVNTVKTLLFLTVSLLVFNKTDDFNVAFNRSLNAFLGNFLPILFLGIIYIAIAFLCMILLLLPVFFVFLPLSVSSTFVLYRVLFDGLELTSDKPEKDDLFI